MREFARRHGDFAIAGGVVAVEVGEDERVRRCGIALLGMGSAPERAAVAEEAVVGTPVDEVDPDEIGRLAVSQLGSVPSDLHGSADFRRRVGASVVTEAWSSAVEEACRG